MSGKPAPGQGSELEVAQSQQIAEIAQSPPPQTGVNATLHVEMQNAIGAIQKSPFMTGLTTKAALTVADGAQCAPFDQEAFKAALQRVTPSKDVPGPFYKAGTLKTNTPLNSNSNIL